MFPFKILISNAKVRRWTGLIPPDAPTQTIGGMECYAAFSVGLFFNLDQVPATSPLHYTSAFSIGIPDDPEQTREQRRRKPHGSFQCALLSSLPEPEIGQSVLYPLVEVCVVSERKAVVTGLFTELPEKRFDLFAFAIEPIQPEIKRSEDGGWEEGWQEKLSWEEGKSQKWQNTGVLEISTLTTVAVWVEMSAETSEEAALERALEYLQDQYPEVNFPDGGYQISSQLKAPKKVPYLTL